MPMSLSFPSTPKRRSASSVSARAGCPIRLSPARKRRIREEATATTRNVKWVAKLGSTGLRQSNDLWREASSSAQTTSRRAIENLRGDYYVAMAFEEASGKYLWQPASTEARRRQGERLGVSRPLLVAAHRGRARRHGPNLCEVLAKRENGMEKKWQRRGVQRRGNIFCRGGQTSAGGGEERRRRAISARPHAREVRFSL